MNATARAYWAVAPGQGEIREEALPEVRSGHLLIRARYSGVSRGTEALVAQGLVPASEHETMRAPHQAGAFPFPVKYGYASVGVVEAGPDAVIGREVFCLYPHQTRYVVPATAVVPLPEGVPAARAVLGANMETALNAVWDGGAAPGQRIVVVGCGVVGALIAWLCGRLPGAEVCVTDINPERAAIAQRLGVGFALPEHVPAAADLVFHASGSAAGLRNALALAGREARIVEVSWYGAREVGLPLGAAFHSRRLVLMSSQVGEVAAAMRPRWPHARRLAKALELLREPCLDGLVAAEATFAQLPDVLPRLAADPAGALAVRIVYPGT